MKITGRDVKLVMIAFLIHPIIILVPTVVAYASGAVSAIGVSGNSVGYTQILYEFTSAAANNGSDFLGASANTPFFNIATAIVMLIGRYAPIAILLALSGSMIGRKRGGTTSGLKTDTLIFTIVLVASHNHTGSVDFLPVPGNRTNSIILQRIGERLWQMKTPLNSKKTKESAPGGMRSAFSGKVLVDSVVRLNPKSLLKNPVMFIVEITFFIVAAMAIVPKAFVPVASPSLQIFYIEVAAILLITVWFSTLSDALAEQQAKSTAGSLENWKQKCQARK